MFASMIVSLTGVALPLVAGVCIAPKDGRQALFTALRNDARVARIQRLVSGHRRNYALSLAAALQPVNLSVRNTSQGHFG